MLLNDGTVSCSALALAAIPLDLFKKARPAEGSLIASTLRRQSSSTMGTCV